MKSQYLLLLLAIVGCIGHPALPQASPADLPGSPFSVILYGPDSEGGYDYTMYAYSGRRSQQSYGTRSLGIVTVNTTNPIVAETEESGVYRITWGEGQNGAYTVIDLVNRQIVEDANPDNGKNQPFRLER